MLKTLAQLLKALLQQPSEILYIGGSDILPAPLSGAEEQELLQKIAQGD